MPQPRVNDGVGQGGPQDAFNSLPVITQYWLGATLVITVTGNFDIVSPMQLVFNWSAITTQFELWRLLTPFCFAGMFQFPTLITIFLIYQFSQRYEKSGPFNTGAGGGTADYAFALIFAVVLIVLTYPLGAAYFGLSPIFCRNLVFFVLYVWSRCHPTAAANIWGIPMQAIYLPFAYLALTMFMGGPVTDMLHGMAVGHLYYFLADVVPKVYGKDILRTPQFLIDQFGVGEYRPEAPARNPAERRGGWGGAGGGNAAGAAAAGGAAGGGGGGRGGGHNWGGGGRALGRD